MVCEVSSLYKKPELIYKNKTKNSKFVEMALGTSNPLLIAQLRSRISLEVNIILFRKHLGKLAYERLQRQWVVNVKIK
jgi:hypothetical protein